MSRKEENIEIAIQISGVKKQYRLGQIGGGTLQADLQSWWARIRGKDDPNLKIGQEQRLVGQTFMALNGIDLTIYKGEALGIIGKNGAGKSTLLKLLSRVTAPSAGTIDIYGRIASMLEVGTGFNGEMTGRENVYMNGAILGMTKAEIDAKMEDIIEFSEVRDFIDTPVKRYSSGMYVKLAFSVAAHLDSEIMIMDEVLAVGDMAFQKKCLAKMREAANKEGRTVLYVSHNMNTIRQLCDRCIVLEQGKIIFDGDVEEAIEKYMENAMQTATLLDYSQVTPVSWVSQHNVKLLRVFYPNKDNCIFTLGDTITIGMEWSFQKKVDNVNFRMVLETQDGIKVAASFYYNLCSGEIGESFSGTFQFDCRSLAPGNYQSYIVFFETDRLGHDVTLEWRRGLDIIIDDRRAGVTAWRTTAWGHMVLPNPQVSILKNSEGD